MTLKKPTDTSSRSMRVDGGDFQSVAERALDFAKTEGASQAELHISQNKGYNVSVRSSDVESIEHQAERSLTITVYHGYRSGSASTTDFSKEALMRVVSKASAFAKNASEDLASGLADPKFLARNYPDLSLYHPWHLSPTEAIEKALHCEQIARQEDKRIVETDSVEIGTFDSHRFYANSHDFIGHYPSSYHQITCGLIGKENGLMEQHYEYTVARDPHELDNVVDVAKRAAKKTAMRLGAKKISTQSCSVIFDAPVAKTLLRSFMQAISGGNIYRKASFLSDSLGQRVFPKFIHLHQRPHLLKGMGSSPFDNEGVRTMDRDYVKNGLLESYLLGSYSARKLGLETTGNAGGVHNLFVNHGEHSLKKLFEEMGQGLFVTDLIGQGVSILTGDYSRGASGFWIENGEIQYPVHEITIAGNLKDIFNGFVAIANDVDHRGNIHTGSIWVNRMMLAGN